MKIIIYITIPLDSFILSFQSDKHFLNYVYLLSACLVLVIVIMFGGYLYRNHHYIFKQKLQQKDLEITSIKDKLYNEQKTQRLVSETQKKVISSLHEKLKFSIDKEEEETTSTFLHTNILPTSEYNEFIHYFHVSHPCLLNYLKAPEFKLTPYEIILCLLAYLKAPESHIEYLLSKKHDALKKARQRIKNKMQISNKDHIGDFLREKMS